MNKFLAFDIEIAMEIPEGVDDWTKLHPMGITCAATWASDESRPRIWCGRDYWGAISHQMSTDELSRLIDHMIAYQSAGYQVLTFAGAGFDFLELAAASNRWDACKSLAWNHVDMMFQTICLLGYTPGLNRLAKGMGLEGKTEGVDGAKAPELWKNGYYGKVLEYVAQDVRTTLDVAQAVIDCGQMRWESKTGRQQGLKINQWLSVEVASLLPEPNVSWMTDPWPRSKFIGWMQV